MRMTNFIQHQYNKFRLNSRLVNIIPIGTFESENEAEKVKIQLDEVKKEYEDALQLLIEETQAKILLVKRKYQRKK